MSWKLRARANCAVQLEEEGRSTLPHQPAKKNLWKMCVEVHCRSWRARPSMIPSPGSSDCVICWRAASEMPFPALGRLGASSRQSCEVAHGMKVLWPSSSLPHCLALLFFKTSKRIPCVCWAEDGQGVVFVLF